MDGPKFLDYSHFILDFISILITLGIFFYGICRFWPDFIKKKEVEVKIKNVTENVKEALECLTEVKIALLNLFLVTKQQLTTDTNKHINAQIGIYTAIEKFIDKLPLIKKSYQIPEILETLMTILESGLEETYIRPSNKSSQILSELDQEWLDKKRPDFTKIEDIRKELMDIYHGPGNYIKKL